MKKEKVTTQLNCYIRPSEDEIVRAAMIRCNFKTVREFVTLAAELLQRGDVDEQLAALRAEKARPLPAWRRDLVAQK